MRYVRNQGLACSVEACDRPAKTKVLCEPHYRKLRKYGDATYEPPQPANKRCRRCWVTKPIDDFYRKGENGHRHLCKPCYVAVAAERNVPEAHATHMRNWRRANPSGQLDASLRYRFGITGDDYQRLLAAQNGVCAICAGTNGDRRLCVDHDHNDGHVRGLLCGECNSGLGLLGDSASRLLAAAAYLDERS